MVRSVGVGSGFCTSFFAYCSVDRWRSRVYACIVGYYVILTDPGFMLLF